MNIHNSNKVSIVILTYNRKDILNILLESLSKLKYSPLEIIVVDNHSEDGTEKLLSSSYPDIIKIRTKKNIGAAARNIGLDRAEGKVIICLDDDVFSLSDDSIHYIMKMFQNNPQIGAINFKVIDYYSGEICNWIHHRIYEDNHDKTFLSYEITEGAVAFSKTALEHSGKYPEYFFLSYEGTDLAFRIINAGYNVIYTGDIVVRHSHSNLGRKSWTNYYYDTRNALWFAMRNLPVGSFMLRFLIRMYSSTFVYAVRDGFLKYWFIAVRDGLLGLPNVLKDRKVISALTMQTITDIDRFRPPFIYQVGKRLFRKNMRL